MPTNAHISIDQIVRSWLGKRGYTIHYYVKALLLAAEAVQELSLTSMPMLHHALLTKADDENWFTLPEGYSDYVRIGVRYGDAWYPLTIDERLMPFPNSNGAGDLVAADFGDDLNISGGNSSWYAGQNTPASFSGSSFNSTNFQTTGTTTPVTPSAPQAGLATIGGWYTGWAYYNPRNKVGLDIANGLIVTQEGFPYNEIYLVYTGIGTIDNMSGIPVIAQAAIEAYIDFKYAANKRDVSRPEANDWERKFDNQHRMLRARIQRWNIQDVADAFERRFLIPVQSTSSASTNSTAVAIPSGSNYYGSQAGSTLPTLSQIQALTAGTGNAVTFPNTSPEYLVYAYPATQTDPTHYYISAFDNGPLGFNGTFASPVTVGSYRVIISNYPTLSVNPVTFS